MEELVFQKDCFFINVNVHQDISEESVIKKVSKDHYLKSYNCVQIIYITLRVLDYFIYQ